MNFKVLRSLLIVRQVSLRVLIEIPGLSCVLKVKVALMLLEIHHTKTRRSVNCE